MLFSKLHCIKGFKLKPSFCKITREGYEEGVARLLGVELQLLDYLCISAKVDAKWT
jgi:hypothetical protein